MSEANQAPEPKWITELKKWGIDVVAFNEQWERAGDNANTQFKEALSNAEANFKTEKSELVEAMDDLREDAEEFIEKMNTAWDDMVSNIQKQLNHEPKTDDSTDETS